MDMGSSALCWNVMLHLWCLVAVYLYIPERRDILEEGWTRIVRIVQGM